MTRVAAVDCGTNSLRLLVADLDPVTGAETELVRELRIVRLGQDVDRTGRISEAAMVRMFAALDEYAAMIGPLAPSLVRCCATSAARDASNAEELVAGMQQRIGTTPEVIGGDEEAHLSFAGATRGLPESMTEPWLVVDIGGGSTELILGDRAGGVQAAQSLDVGSVRLTERHLHGDPPTDAEVAAAVADIDEALDGCGVDLQSPGTVIGVAGTVTTVAAGVLGLAAYDREAIHLSDLDVTELRATGAKLLGLPQARRRELGYLHPGRVDVIGGGALVLDRILRRTPVRSLRVSEHDILDAIAWSLV